MNRFIATIRTLEADDFGGDVWSTHAFPSLSTAAEWLYDMLGYWPAANADQRYPATLRVADSVSGTIVPKDEFRAAIEAVRGIV